MVLQPNKSEEDEINNGDIGMGSKSVNGNTSVRRPNSQHRPTERLGIISRFRILKLNSTFYFQDSLEKLPLRMLMIMEETYGENDSMDGD